MKDYNKKNIPLAKGLRKNMTPWERKLWYDFLHNYPVRFQRQKAIGNYIADFYCAKARLVIELDGGGHYTPEQKRKDKQRTHDLNAMNLTVVRICNLDIDRNFRGVCEYVDRLVQNSLPQSASLTAPSSEGALDAATSKQQAKNPPREISHREDSLFYEYPPNALPFGMGIKDCNIYRIQRGAGSWRVRHILRVWF